MKSLEKKNNISITEYDSNRLSDFDSRDKFDKSESEEEIELYAESEQILDFKNSMVDLKFGNLMENQDYLKESLKYKNDFTENIDNRRLNKNNSDFNSNNNNNFSEQFNSPNEQREFKKLIKRKNSVQKRDLIDENEPSEKKNNLIKDKINVHQSAVANQYKIKIGDVDLSDHFYKENTNFSEEKKNLRERLETQNQRKKRNSKKRHCKRNSVSNIRKVMIDDEYFDSNSESDKYENHINNSSSFYEMDIANLRKKLKNLREEKDIINEELNNLKMKFKKQTDELTDQKEKNESNLSDISKQTNQIQEFKNQINKIKEEISEKDNTISLMKIDIRKKDDRINDFNDEMHILKSQNAIMKTDLSSIKLDLQKKIEIISDLNNKITSLEQENTKLKNQSTEGTSNLRDHQMNYENLKTSYKELKNQFELINLKFQNLSEENYSLKKESLNLGKEIRSKNELIDSLKQEIISSSKNKNFQPFKNENNTSRNYIEQSTNSDSIYFNEKKHDKNYTTMVNKSISNNESSLSIKSNTIDYDDYDYSINKREGNNLNLPKNRNFGNLNSDVSFSSKSNKILNNDSNIFNASNYSNERVVNNNRLTNLQQKNTETNINVLPSQKNILQKENLILSIETKLYTLQQEKDQISSEFSKLPEFPKMKVQILKKKELELKISDLTKQINGFKAELRELNAHTKNY